MVGRPVAVLVFNRSVWNTGGYHSWFLDHTGHNRHSWPGTGTSYWKATRRPDPRAFILSGSRAGRDAQGAPRAESSAGGQ
ncbi:hypothetical protein [Microbispora bryophytorum]|uniref:hypothetical protein n=1 Tax=Microbispora bryophytorum TaxID=1460882 RepID=UPI0033DC532C